MKTPQTRVELIVGLGNPGAEYSGTRHNAGQDFVEALAQSVNTPLLANAKFYGFYTKANVNGRNIHLLVPTTYMNRSGLSVAAVCQFYKIAPESILVAHDELDLEPGIGRLKIGGGHGGHNGLRDIISALGNNKNFGRLRLGIGHPGNAKLVSNFVLKKAPASDRDLIATAQTAALHQTPKLIEGDWEGAMRELHTKT